MNTIATILRDGNRSALLAVLNQRRDKRYRGGVLQLAVLIGLITQEEWSRLFHGVRCGQRKFGKGDLA